jgi:kynurenine formamidase
MTEKNILLLSHVLDCETPSYGNRDKLTIESISKISEGASANSSKWIFSSNHLGTHIDTPNHFFDNGNTLTDYQNTFWFSNKVQLIDLPVENAILINPKHFYNKINPLTEILLIRTGYEKFRGYEKYWNDNPGLSEELGLFLRKEFPTIRIIGFDFISLTSWIYRREGKLAHLAFLNPSSEGKPICIIEDMALNSVKDNLHQIFIIPIFIKGANGGPVTVFANQNS